MGPIVRTASPSWQAITSISCAPNAEPTLRLWPIVQKTIAHRPSFNRRQRTIGFGAWPVFTLSVAQAGGPGVCAISRACVTANSGNSSSVVLIVVAIASSAIVLGLGLPLAAGGCLYAVAPSAEGPYGSNAEGCAAGLPPVAPRGVLMARGCTAPGCQKLSRAVDSRASCDPCTPWTGGGRVIRVLESVHFLLVCYRPLANSAAPRRLSLAAHSIEQRAYV